MRKLQKSVNILGLSVKVCIAPNLVDSNGNTLFGYYDPEKREIWLEENQDAECMHRTFLHEFGHAFLDRIGLRVAIPLELQEVLVEGFANVLHENFFQKKPKRR